MIGRFLRPQTGARIFVIGDIHGCFVSLTSAVSQIFDEEKFDEDVDYLIFTGDFTERGKYSLLCLMYVMKLHQQYPDHVVVLRGNHESAFQWELGEPYVSLSYTINVMHGFYSFESQCMKCSFLEYVSKLPSVALIDKTIICHGFIPKLEALKTRKDLELLMKMKISNDYRLCPEETSSFESLFAWTDIVLPEENLLGHGNLGVSLDDWKKMKKDLDLKYIVCGHQHSACKNKTLKDNGVFVNITSKVLGGTFVKFVVGNDPEFVDVKINNAVAINCLMLTLDCDIDEKVQDYMREYERNVNEDPNFKWQIDIVLDNDFNILFVRFSDTQPKELSEPLIRSSSLSFLA